MNHKSISKRVRELVYNKYNGHCAYCGCELEYKDMQVDHLDSVWMNHCLGKETEQDDSIDNLMPSCRQCNYYKSTSSVEEFRKNITDMLFKNLQKFSEKDAESLVPHMNQP